MLSRWFNETEQEKIIKKIEVLIRKFTKLKEDFPELKLNLWISIDDFSWLDKNAILVNTFGLLNIIKIVWGKHIYISWTKDIENEDRTLDIVNNVTRLVAWFYNIDDFKLHHSDNIFNSYKSDKENLELIFHITNINFDWRGEKQVKRSYKLINKEEKFQEIIKNQKIENYWTFNCSVITNPKKISIQSWWNIKTCWETHLKYQKEYNYWNIKWMNENDFIQYIAEWQISMYKDFTIDKILKLIKSKREWNFICVNNMIASKQKREK